MKLRVWEIQTIFKKETYCPYPSNDVLWIIILNFTFTFHTSLKNEVELMDDYISYLKFPIVLNEHYELMFKWTLKPLKLKATSLQRKVFRLRFRQGKAPYECSAETYAF